jgi:tagatose 1,6-diphosphate aldolase
MKALAEALAEGARGFLAGRAFWLDALSAYPDLEAVEARLKASVERLRAAADLLSRASSGAAWR